MHQKLIFATFVLEINFKQLQFAYKIPYTLLPLVVLITVMRKKVLQEMFFFHWNFLLCNFFTKKGTTFSEFAREFLWTFYSAWISLNFLYLCYSYSMYEGKVVLKSHIRYRFTIQLLIFFTFLYKISTLKN